MAARHHPHRRRLGRPRVGPGLPAGRAAGGSAAHRLDPGLVRRVPGLHLLHGDPVAAGGDGRGRLGPARRRPRLSGRGGLGLVRGAPPVRGGSPARGGRGGDGGGAGHPRSLRRRLQAGGHRRRCHPPHRGLAHGPARRAGLPRSGAGRGRRRPVHLRPVVQHLRRQPDVHHVGGVRLLPRPAGGRALHGGGGPGAHRRRPPGDRRGSAGPSRAHPPLLDRLGPGLHPGFSAGRAAPAPGPAPLGAGGGASGRAAERLVGAAVPVEPGAAQRHGLVRAVGLRRVAADPLRHRLRAGAVVPHFPRLRLPGQRPPLPALRGHGRRGDGALLHPEGAARHGPGPYRVVDGAGLRAPERGEPVERGCAGLERENTAFLLFFGIYNGGDRPERGGPVGWPFGRGRLGRIAPVEVPGCSRSVRPGAGAEGAPRAAAGRRCRRGSRRRGGNGAGGGGAPAPLAAGGPGERRGRLPVGTVAHRAVQPRRLLGRVQLRGLRAQGPDRGRGRVIGVLCPSGRHGRSRPGARLRPVAVGVRQGAARVLRHPHGPDAAAVLDRRLHRLHGGPLLRGVGHHPVPLPHAVGAVGGPVEVSAQSPVPLRGRRRGGGRSSPAHGRPLLHGLLRAGPGAGSGRARSERGGQVGALDRLRGGRQRSRRRP